MENTACPDPWLHVENAFDMRYPDGTKRFASLTENELDELRVDADPECRNCEGH